MKLFVFRTLFVLFLLIFLLKRAFTGTPDTSFVNFDITTYQFYPFTYKSLELSPYIDLDGNITHSELFDKVFKHHGIGGISLYYESDKELEFKQKYSFFNISLFGDYRITGREIESGSDHSYSYSNYHQGEKIMSIGASVSYRNNLRFYSPKNMFFELDIDPYFYYSGPDLELSEYEEEVWYSSFLSIYSYRSNKNLRFSFRLNPDFAMYVGKGRITDVTYPAIGIHVLKKLSGRGILQRKVLPADIKKLSQLFEILKNDRSFDYREKRVADIKKICAFLEKEKYVTSITPEAIMEILDYWEYAFSQRRSSGFRYGFGIKESGYVELTSRSTEDFVFDTLLNENDTLFEKIKEDFIDSIKSLDDYTVDYFFRGVSSTIKYGLASYLEFRKPYRLVGQFEIGAETFTGLEQKYDEDTRNTLFGILNTDVKYYWYPTVRTTVLFNIFFDFTKYYWNFNVLGQEDYIKNRNEIYTGFLTNINYYVNPRLCFSISGSCYYLNNRNLYDKNYVYNDFYYSVSFDLVYKIF